MKFLHSRVLANTLIIALGVFTLSCGNDEEPEPDTNSEKATLRLRIENIDNNDLPIELNKDYITENGDTLQITALQYFLSNVVLMDDDGGMQILPESYYLIKTTSESSETIVEISGLETGNYTSIHFGFGVDSSANHTSATDEGDLDPLGADGMIWNWDSGYKFLKLEGNFRTDTTTNGSFSFHVGGDANYKAYKLGAESEEHMEHMKTSSLNLSLESGKTREVHLKASILNIFDHPNLIDLDVTNQAHGSTAQNLAENYGTDLFEVHHTLLED